MMSVTYLKTVLTYCADSGTLTWLKRPESHFSNARICNSWNAKHAGKVAGNQKPDGYFRVAVDGVRYQSHRIAWAIYHGEMAPPELVIDHIDQDPSNNRISNLRAVTHQENMRNQPIRKNNSSGVSGVSYSKKEKKWLARINVKGRYARIGAFEDFEDAVSARKQAEIDRGFHCNHGRARDQRELDAEHNRFMSILDMSGKVTL